MQGACAIDITDGDRFVYYATPLGDFTQSIIVAIALFEHQNRGEINKLRERGKNWKNSFF